MESFRDVWREYLVEQEAEDAGTFGTGGKRNLDVWQVIVYVRGSGMLILLSFCSREREGENSLKFWNTLIREFCT